MRLKEISKLNMKYISFDIFDTLIFRTVKAPKDVFKRVYHKNSELFPEYLNDAEWCELRATTESLINKRGSEIVLEEIYDALPSVIKNKDTIMQLEIETEIESCYLNPEIDELIRYLIINHKKIILVSDMYLSTDIIKMILTKNGFDINLVEKIYVSSEYGVRKSGGLFEQVLKDLNIDSSQIFHVGDNSYSDILSADKLGIKTYHYNLISDAKIKYPELFVEDVSCGNICPEIYSLRILSASENPYTDKRSKKLFDIGALYLGPIFTYFTEWVLDCAEENNIKRILPLMREGKFFSKLLNNANEYRTTNFEIEPVYISRKAFYPAILKIIEKKDIEYLLNTLGMKVKDIFKVLGIEEYLFHFAGYEETCIEDTQYMYNENVTVYSEIEAFLKDSSTIEVIRSKSYDDETFLFKYFEQLKMTTEDHIIIDVGWRGTAQNMIKRILKQNNAIDAKELFLLTNSEKRMLTERNLDNDIEIWGYLSNYGSDGQLFRELNIKLFEMVVLCDEGSTIGYKKSDNGKISPLKADIVYSDKMLDYLSKCQEGIEAFQKKYLQLKHMGKFGAVKAKREELLKLAGCLYNFPTYEQAEALSKFEFDQNMCVEEKWDIVNEEVLSLYMNNDLLDFFKKNTRKELQWILGLETLKNPLKYLENKFFYSKAFDQVKIINYVKYIISLCRDTGENVVLVGAGNYSQSIIKYLNLAGNLDLVEAITDSVKGNRGLSVCDISIKTIDEVKSNGFYVITSFQKRLIEEMKKDILSVNYNAKIVTYFDIKKDV